ncbi:MAG: decaprenyl-phosphate phosphoribosyltransferase [Thermomicrobiales bacterium]
MTGDQPPASTVRSTVTLLDVVAAVVRGMRPAQWTKNGLVLAGLVFGGKLLDAYAVGLAVAAVFVFCLVSGGFYLINDVRDIEADRLHPGKRIRPVASGELAPSLAFTVGLALIAVAIAGAAVINAPLLLIVLGYAGLSAAYNLGLKDVVIVDVFAIACGFMLRAVAGAVAVDVSISPWLLAVTMMLALLIGFGKRRYELISLPNATSHRRNLETYSRPMLDQFVTLAAAGTLISYTIYALDGNNVAHDPRFILTAPVVAFGIFRYLLVLYQHGQGGAPETLLLTDRPLLIAVLIWALLSATLIYLPR